MSVSDENQNPLLRVEKWTADNLTADDCESSLKTDLRSNRRTRNVNGSHKYETNFTDPDVQCGFTNCMKPPNWLQRLTTKRTFLLVFCLSTVLQGMYYTYFVSVLTTIEKLFQIRSQTAGVIMSATEIGQIGGGLLLSYYGGGGHRPRWIASGMLLFGVSASISALPHFLFGDTLVKEFLASTPSQDNPFKTANVCRDQDLIEGGALLDPFFNNTVGDLGYDSKSCDIPNSTTKIVLGIFFIALLGVGVGQTAVYNLGIPYIDDNVASEESPTYFGITMGVRILGPTFGFLLGSLCTRLSIDPFSKPKYDPTDPRWISAWWLGHVLISSCIILTSFVMVMFPKKLPDAISKPFKRNSHLSHTNSIDSEAYEDISPLTEECISIESSAFLKSAKTSPSPASGDIYSNRDIHSYNLEPSSLMDTKSIMEKEKLRIKEFHSFKETQDKPRGQRSMKDFVQVVWRLLKNKILILRTLSSVLHMLPIAGLYTFLPKYIETQFRLPVHSAAMISGVGGILVMGFGIFISGIVIRKLNPPLKLISGWIAITALLYSLGMIILMFLGCSHQDVQGISLENVGFQMSHFRPVCGRNCTDCNTETFAPICSEEGKTYFSACHAGCRSVSLVNETQEMIFSDCECLNDDVTATLRLCESQCTNLVWYVVVFCIFVIIHSTSEVGGMLITLRCVSPKDKAMALGLISVAIGLFANVPCPIMYGAVIDNACIHWRKTCDGQGACQIYDPDTFRTYFHGTTSFIMLLAFFVDLMVWRCCKGISLSGNDDFHESTKANSSSLQSNPPSSTLTIDKHETESTMSSSVSSQRKRESLEEEEEEDNDSITEKPLEKENRTLDMDQKHRPLKFQYEVSNYPLRESII